MILNPKVHKAVSVSLGKIEIIFTPLTDDNNNVTEIEMSYGHLFKKTLNKTQFATLVNLLRNMYKMWTDEDLPDFIQH